VPVVHLFLLADISLAGIILARRVRNLRRNIRRCGRGKSPIWTSCCTDGDLLPVLDEFRAIERQNIRAWLDFLADVNVKQEPKNIYFALN
jgi:hypothetical protein